VGGKSGNRKTGIRMRRIHRVVFMSGIGRNVR
jgi:hypothetical protein